MKLTIIALGSRGDVQPCVALGRGLAAAGYAVRVATMEQFKSLVESQGLEFFRVEGDVQALVNELLIPQQREASTLSLWGTYRAMRRSFGAITEHYHRAFADAALRDSEAILSQLPGGFYGFDLAETLGVPYVALSVVPQEMTGAWPLSLFPNRRSWGRWYNRQTYRIGQQLAWRPFRQPINQFRRDLGLRPAAFGWGNIRRMARERVPVVQGFSPHVIPPQPEWGDHVHTTGYWVLDEPDWTPSAELSAFLDGGDPPVFVGFGSMPIAKPAQTAALILEALAQYGKRGILQGDWATAAPLPDTVFALDYAPYAWLFPRMAAIVHHGGSGTTGFALRAGVPSLVIPFIADQPFWGERTYALKVGPKPIPFTKLTVTQLAHAIYRMIESPPMHRRASQLKEAMRAENGVSRAVEIIRNYLEG